MEERTTDFILGGIISFFAWFFGGIDGFLIVLITFSVVDGIFGTLDNYIHGGLNLKDFWDVFSRKIGEFCYVGIAHIIDKYMIGNTATFRTAMTLFYIIVESKSLIKHSEALKFPVPQFFRKRFSEWEEKLNKDDSFAMRGEGIKKAIGSEIFREPEKKDDIDTIYKRLYEKDKS